MGIWLGIGAVLIVISCILYSCIRVGAQADREMERMMKELFD